MLIRIIILIFNFSVWSIPFAFADCNKLANKFSLNQNSLKVEELADLYKCVDDSHKIAIKSTKLAQRKNTSNCAGDCIKLAQKYSQKPKNMSGDELSDLCNCIADKMSANFSKPNIHPPVQAPASNHGSYNSNNPKSVLPSSKNTP